MRLYPEARINQEQTISKDLTLWNQQGLADLARLMQGAAPEAAKPEAVSAAQVAGAPAAASAALERRLDSIRGHLRRYRELVSQGKWADAGKELEGLEAEAGRR